MVSLVNKKEINSLSKLEVGSFNQNIKAKWSIFDDSRYTTS